MRILPILLALLLPVSAQETMIREVFDPKTDTHVEVVALFSEPSNGGFLPVRVKVANNLQSDRSIALSFNSHVGYDRRIQTKSDLSITAPAGKTVTRDIMVPLCHVLKSGGHQASFTATLRGSLGDAENTIRASSASSSAGVLMSDALFTPNASALNAALTKSSGRSYGNQTFAVKFTPGMLPDDWLAYSGYDSIILTDTDWSDVPAGARNAILSWATLGGQIVIFSTSSATAASLGLPEDLGFGSSLIRPISTDLKLKPTETITLVSSENPARLRGDSLNADYQGSWPLQGTFGAKNFRYGIFIAVLIAFGILVGPVNLFVLAKSGRRHRLFITTPLISLAASLILIALIIFQDGFGGEGIRRVLMEVRPDSDRNAAFLHQEQFSRTGILSNSRFDVDPPCLFTPVPITKSRWARFTNDYNTRGTFNLQPSGARLLASGDWWQSRSEYGHALSAVVPTRGRIETTSSPTTFVSTFDFPIGTLFYLDPSGQWHRADSIATGKPFTLSPVDRTMATPAISAEAMAFTARNRTFLERASKRPGHFVAITRHAPAIDTHRAIRWKQTQTVITGPVVSP